MSDSRFWRIAERLSVVAVIAVSILILLRLLDGPNQQTVARLPVEPIRYDDAPNIGDSNAPVVMMVFSDFECPACLRFSKEAWPAVNERYVKPGRLLVAFRHMPLPNHKNAKPAAQAAECARKQGQFWQMHDRLFQDPRRLTSESFLAHASDLGLDGDRFQSCLDSNETLPTVERDLATALGLDLDSTPTFLIGRRQSSGVFKVANKMIGARSSETFSFAIDSVR